MFVYQGLGFLFLAVQTVEAVQFFNNATVPENLSDNCEIALTVNITQCDNVVGSLNSGFYYPQQTLQRVCTPACADALVSYEQSVQGACGPSDVYSLDEGATSQISIAPALYKYMYDLICLMDGGRYCNVVLGEAADAEDPIGMLHVTMTLYLQLTFLDNGDQLLNIRAANGTDPCDLCYIKNLQYQAGSPFFDGPVLASQSIYQSKTASCGITGYPLTTTSLGVPT